MQTEFYNILVNLPDPHNPMSEKVRELLSKGYNSEDILNELELLRTVLKSNNMEKEEDIVLEIMDYLIGWCSPHMKL